MAAKKKFDWLHVAISWGASVVILGALFKILHIGGSFGNYAIGIGLGVEAFLFFLTGFRQPEAELPWEKVYPELKDDFNGELPKATIRQQAAPSVSSTAALDKMLNDAKVGPELIQSLSVGLQTFSSKVAAISNAADISLATDEFSAKIKAASANFDGLNQAFARATSQMAEIGNSSSGAAAYQEQVTTLTKNLSALNAVYELELKESSQHLKSMSDVYRNLSETMNSFNESLDDAQQFKQEVGKLSKNLASLNAVYGNMLSAMNQTRA